MEFLGVGPGELIVILIIALVVVGPERLPVLARQAGKMLVQVRNWVQKSPDAAMVLRARQEIEAELANLRESLAEVQNARDEVVNAARQVNTLVKEDVIGATRESLEEITQGAIPRATKPNGLPATAAATAETNGMEPTTSAEGEMQIVAPDGRVLSEVSVADTQPVIELPALETEQTIAPPRPVEVTSDSGATVSTLQAQIVALAEELRLLQMQLQERGVLAPAPLVHTNGMHANGLEVPDVSDHSILAQQSTLEEPADVEQHVYTRD